MFNGRFSYFKHLGLYWCLGFLAFAQVKAEISRTDLAEIEYLLTIIRNYAGDASHSAEHIEQYTAAAKDSLIDITEILESVVATPLVGPPDEKYVRVQDEPLLDALEDLAVNLQAFQNQVVLKLGNIAQNVALNSTPSIYTNFPFLVLSSYLGSSSNADYSEAEIRVLYKYLLGREPTSEELQNAVKLVTQFGSGRAFISDFISQVPSANSLDFDPELVDFYSTLVGQSMLSKKQRDTLRKMGKVRYALYGTRPILQFLQYATNDYHLSSVVYKNEESGKSRFGNDFLNTVGDLAGSTESLVSTNIAGIATNDIVQVKNDSYFLQLDKIKNDSLKTPLDGDLTSSIQVFESSFVNAITPVADAESVRLDFGQIGFLNQSQDVSFTLTRFPSRYYTVLRYLYGVLKLINLFIVGVCLYDFIQSSVSM